MAYLSTPSLVYNLQYKLANEHLKKKENGTKLTPKKFDCFILILFAQPTPSAELLIVTLRQIRTLHLPNFNSANLVFILL